MKEQAQTLIRHLLYVAAGFGLTVILVGSTVGIWALRTRNNVDAPSSPTPELISIEKISEKTPQTVVADLMIPWEVVFFSDGTMGITERSGSIVHIKRDGTRREFPVDNVIHTGEGGLLGMAIHPDFEHNQSVYVYRTVETENGLTNEIVHFLFDGEEFVEDDIILNSIPGAQNHNGGRIAFGPDGYLYVTTGDAQDPDTSQDKDSLAGKILRITDEGRPAPGNPFNNEVYSYGHRNPQGLVWDDEGRLWSTEHGAAALDELNLIEAGKNYGWPAIQGDEAQEGMETPVLHSGTDETWAPSGLAYWNDSLVFGGLRGESVYEVIVRNGDITEFNRHVSGEFGRLRAVTVGPDNALYVATSNRDGRGRPTEGDDRVLRITDW